MTNQYIQPARRDIEELLLISQHIAESRYFKDTYTESQAFVKALAGRELGIPPVTAQRCVYVIEGNIILSANTMGAMIRRSGIYDYSIKEHSNNICTLVAFRIIGNDDQRILGECSFSMEDAKLAGLLDPTRNGKTRANWVRYPSDMLFARAISRLIKRFMPDLTIMPTYTPDEFGIAVNEEGEVEINVTESPPPPAQIENKSNITALETEIVNMAKRAKADPVATRERIKQWCLNVFQKDDFNKLTTKELNRLTSHMPTFESALIREQIINAEEQEKLLNIFRTAGFLDGNDCLIPAVKSILLNHFNLSLDLSKVNRAMYEYFTQPTNISLIKFEIEKEDK